jgi:hypothetical protein
LAFGVHELLAIYVVIKDEALGAELTKFVPFDVMTFPEVPAVAGYVAVEYVGSALAPPDCKTCPADPAAVAATGLVACPKSTP